MTEDPYFFGNPDRLLFGIFHAAADAARTPFVFCHAFGEEKLWTHRTMVTFARELASRGHAVLRFDYRGNGDSEGTFAEFSLDGALADLDAAIANVKARTGGERVALLGLRFGATVAALAADARSDVERLVLWAPVVNGSRFMQEVLRINLATQMAVYREIRDDREALVETMRQGRTVNVDGYAMSYALYEQVSAVDLLASERRFGGPCFIAHLDRRPAVPPAAELAQLQARFPAATLASVQEEPFWKEIDRFYETAPNLFGRTLAWMDSAEERQR